MKRVLSASIPSMHPVDIPDLECSNVSVSHVLSLYKMDYIKNYIAKPRYI